METAIFEHDAKSILGEGYAYDRCQVGVVTDLQMDASLAEYYIREPEQMHTVMRTQVDVVLSEGMAVLHAADPAVAELASLCDGTVLFYALDPDLPVIAEHRARGGRAVFLRDNQVVIAGGTHERPFFDLGTLPSAMNGNPRPATLAYTRCSRDGAGTGHPAGPDSGRDRNLRVAPFACKPDFPFSIDMRPAQAAVGHPHRNRRSWKYHVSAHCAAPISGAGTPPSRPW